MKSLLPLLAGLTTLALATPIMPIVPIPCVCENMCPQSIPLDCECELKAQKACASTLPSTCPRPMIVAQCATTPTPGNGTEPEPEHGEGQVCGGRGSKAKPCDHGYICSFPNMNIDRRDADMSGRCVPHIPIPPKPKPFPGSGNGTAPGNNTVPHNQGQVCGTRGAKPCGEGYVCKLPDMEMEHHATDMPGHCVPKTVSTVPVPVQGGESEEGAACGTRGAKPCGAGMMCSFENTARNIMDAPGKCVKYDCGGFIGKECAGGHKCVLDRKCLKHGGSDCEGKCESLVKIAVREYVRVDEW